MAERSSGRSFIAPGTRFGSYEILELIGTGGMGNVYRARDDKLRRTVAIKVLPDEVADDPLRIERFEREARAASALNHPGIVTVHDFGRDGSRSYLVMEWIEGETLREKLVAGPLPLVRAPRHGDPRRGGPREGSRRRDRPSRPEAGEPDGDGGRPRQDSRLRAGEGARADVPGRSRAGDALRDGDGWNRHGNGALHGARAGQRPPRRLPGGPLLLRSDPVRDGDGQRALPSLVHRRDVRRDPALRTVRRVGNDAGRPTRFRCRSSRAASRRTPTIAMPRRRTSSRTSSASASTLRSSRRRRHRRARQPGPHARVRGPESPRRSPQRPFRSRRFLVVRARRPAGDDRVPRGPPVRERDQRSRDERRGARTRRRADRPLVRPEWRESDGAELRPALQRPGARSRQGRP